MKRGATKRGRQLCVHGNMEALKIDGVKNQEYNAHLLPGYYYCLA